MKKWMLLAAMAVVSINAAAHELKCESKQGIDKARCERHEKIFAKCSPIKGEAHYACDREMLIANPLDCSKFTGKDQEMCSKEVKAQKTCEANQGIEYMKCVKKEVGTSPMG